MLAIFSFVGFIQVPLDVHTLAADVGVELPDWIDEVTGALPNVDIEASARLSLQARLAVATAAWYRKKSPTFADTLAAVRREIWREQGFLTSQIAPDVKKLRPALLDGITYALCHAA